MTPDKHRNPNEQKQREVNEQMNEQTKSFEKRDQLVEAAIEEFGDKGYEQASLNNILKVAGISKGTFYYHFKNKEDLYIYIVVSLGEKKKQFFSDHLDPSILSQDLFTILEAMIELGLRFATEVPYVTKFSLNFIKDNDHEMYQKVIKLLGEESNAYMDHLIERAYENGEINSEFPIEFVKKMITYLFIHIVEIGDINSIDDYKPVAGYLIKFMKNGLSKH